LRISLGKILTTIEVLIETAKRPQGLGIPGSPPGQKNLIFFLSLLSRINHTSSLILMSHPMTQTRFTELIDKYLLEALTDPERAELAAALEEEAYAAQAKEIIHGFLAKQQFNYGPDLQDLYARIEKNLIAERPKVAFIRRFRWVAAAVVVLAIATTYLAVFKRDSRPVVAFKDDVPAPAVSRPTLILAGGKKIILDSVASGSLAGAGAASAEKTSDGKLIYHATAAIEFNTLSNPRGSKPVQLQLPDKTIVWLNAESSVTFPTAFTGSSREVTLTGEAFFEVVHNAEKPFRVHASDQTIEDIGTSFNVNAYADEPGVRSTLVEGSVKIGKTILRPGQQYVNGIVTTANIEQTLAWKNGLFSFDQADIHEVMKQLSRWYNVEVIYEGKIDYVPFQGEIGRDLTLAQVLKGLEQIHVHFRIEEDKRIIIMP
jgi:transmembrane sensor